MVEAQRRIPKWSELKPLLRTAPLELDATKRRLSKAYSIADLREIARRRTPRAVFDYTDGAAEDELSLRRARDAFAGVQFTPNILRDVSQLDTSVELLGARSSYPFILAPTGFTRMMHHEGEPAVARVAQDWGVPYALSTMGTTTIEDVTAAAPRARRWFQLYVWRDRSKGEDLMRRAHESGYDTLVLTVDVAVAGARLRDSRNGFTIPPTLTARTVANAAIHPAWWVNMLTTAPLEFANLGTWGGTVAELIDSLFDPTMTFNDLDWVRQNWPGKLVIKGIQNVDDAKAVLDAGADALVLSNHGGRQLDRAPVPVELLPRTLEVAGGNGEVYVDTGVMSGADIVAALAQGARAVMVGRAYLYGLMAGGQAGVQRAMEILTAEIARTMRLIGVGSVAELRPEHASFPELPAVPTSIGNKRAAH